MSSVFEIAVEAMKGLLASNDPRYNVIITNVVKDAFDVAEEMIAENNRREIERGHTNLF